MPRSRRYDVYVRFMHALANGNDEAARACVDPSRFYAELWKGRFNFKEFVAEVNRQRKAFHDFGKNISGMRWQDSNGKARADYTMQVTFSGRLADGKGNFLEPNGKKVAIPTVDHIVFDSDGRIIRLTSIVPVSMIIEGITDKS